MERGFKRSGDPLGMFADGDDTGAAAIEGEALDASASDISAPDAVRKSTTDHRPGSDIFGPAPNSTEAGSFQHGQNHATHLGLIAKNPLDTRSIAGGLIGGAVYFALAYFSLSLFRFDSLLAAVWFPSAIGVAFLLRARFANEVPFYAAAYCACAIANIVNGNPLEIALVFALANMANVCLVTWLTRRSSGDNADMSDLATLGRFTWMGGLLGPLASIVIAAPALALEGQLTGEAAFSWFLTESMGMMLIVPTVLLVCDAIEARDVPEKASLAEVSWLLAVGAACAVLVFSQSLYPLLFLIPPVTLLQAFRLGSMGTALHVMVIAVAAITMTWAGYGPIYEVSAAPTARLHLLQAFIAANFLIGLPVAAILAGRDRLTEIVKEGRRELTLLAESITDAVLKSDVDGVCTYASPSVRDVLGRRPEDFIGRPIAERTPAEAGDRIKQALSNLLQGRSDKERLTYRRLIDDSEGLPVFIEADCAIALDPVTGERDGIVMSARDVTERVELELLLTRARRKAEKAASAKSDFLANMSHEIRTPMNGVLGFAELMMQGKLDEEQRRYAEMIVESGRSMMMLLNDVLDLSKIEAGQIVIDKHPIDLCETIEECVALHRPSAEKKGIILRLSAAPQGIVPRDTPTDTNTQPTRPVGAQGPVVLTDGMRLRQIVLNLISNAVKFTESGTVAIHWAAHDDELVLTVQDTGIGINAKRIEAIFRPFTQAESDTARRYGGTGLGLSISRQLAELLGGQLSVESVPGEGSTFTLKLPASQVAADTLPKPEPAQIVPRDLPQRARVLLAEDHDVNRVLATEMLERCGQSVEIAHEGNEAITMVMDSVLRGAPFELVLMDIQMPGCDGYAAARAIREEGIGPDILPIIALTANAFPEDIRAAREAGMQGHLAKPFKFADLAKVLQRWLPTQIVETPMDRDFADQEDAEASALASTVASTPMMAQTSASDAGAHSSALLDRWLKRRHDAIELVRDALRDGLLGPQIDGADTNAERQLEDLVRQIHKLAGTAATFGEAELGEQAALLERALRSSPDQARGCEECETLAFELLALADEPPEPQPTAGRTLG